jgi:hypothetical protein
VLTAIRKRRFSSISPSGSDKNPSISEQTPFQFGLKTFISLILWEDCATSDPAIYRKKIMNGRGDCTGEEIVFPVADGFVHYIVLSIRFAQLIHLAIGDAWQFSYVERLTAKDVMSPVARTRMRNRLFSAAPRYWRS